jgi:hypothetical protein
MDSKCSHIADDIKKAGLLHPANQFNSVNSAVISLQQQRLSQERQLKHHQQVQQLLPGATGV